MDSKKKYHDACMKIIDSNAKLLEKNPKVIVSKIMDFLISTHNLAEEKAQIDAIKFVKQKMGTS